MLRRDRIGPTRRGALGAGLALAPLLLATACAAGAGGRAMSSPTFDALPIASPAIAVLAAEAPTTIAPPVASLQPDLLDAGDVTTTTTVLPSATADPAGITGGVLGVGAGPADLGESVRDSTAPARSIPHDPLTDAFTALDHFLANTDSSDASVRGTTAPSNARDPDPLLALLGDGSRPGSGSLDPWFRGENRGRRPSTGKARETDLAQSLADALHRDAGGHWNEFSLPFHVTTQRLALDHPAGRKGGVPRDLSGPVRRGLERAATRAITSAPGVRDLVARFREFEDRYLTLDHAWGDGGDERALDRGGSTVTGPDGDGVGETPWLSSPAASRREGFFESGRIKMRVRPMRYDQPRRLLELGLASSGIGFATNLEAASLSVSSLLPGSVRLLVPYDLSAGALPGIEWSTPLGSLSTLRLQFGSSAGGSLGPALATMMEGFEDADPFDEDDLLVAFVSVETTF